MRSTTILSLLLCAGLLTHCTESPSPAGDDGAVAGGGEAAVDGDADGEGGPADEGAEGREGVEAEGEGEGEGDEGEGEGEGEGDEGEGEDEGGDEGVVEPQICGGRGNPPCDGHQFCNFDDDADCGRADGPGVCEDRPLRCERDCPGVCGCDGDTYCNACIAATQGVSVDHQGRCEGDPEPQICGTRGAGPCPDNNFCDFPIRANCGRADAPGVCRPIPEACQRDCPQVCGCDGQTYCNACVASRAGVGIDALDPCDDVDRPEMCGGIAGLVCEVEDDYCHMEPGQCRINDAGGVCRPRPEVCQRDCPQVCGCDGQTYCNECVANLEGVNVLRAGQCERPPRDDERHEEVPR